MKFLTKKWIKTFERVQNDHHEQDDEVYAYLEKRARKALVLNSNTINEFKLKEINFDFFRNKTIDHISFKNKCFCFYFDNGYIKLFGASLTNNKLNLSLAQNEYELKAVELHKNKHSVPELHLLLKNLSEKYFYYSVSFTKLSTIYY